MEQQRLAVFDLDGTLFRWQLFHELVFELKNQALFDESTALKLDEALLGWQSKHASWDEYEGTVVSAIIEHAVDIQPRDFEIAAKAVLERSGHKIYNYTAKLAKQLAAQNYRLLAVSGSYQEIAEPFATKYGFDDCIGALLERKNGRFTGKIERVTYGRKAEIVTEYARNHGLSLDGSVAIGDSGGDISMLELVERPIAFNPNEQLLDIALEKAWEVVVERKNIAYHLNRNEHGHIILAQTDRF